MYTAIATLLILFWSGFPSLTKAYTKDAMLDQVLSLPRALEPPKSNQFSGFLQIDAEKFIHYFYFESENDPINDPIIFWTNGGPGCSGQLGLFTEMGPYRPAANGSLTRNPFSWTRMSSMVFLEQPVGVGYSFTTNKDLLSTFNDLRASIDNLKILKAFFGKFPERKNNDFYLASESYGGHYIPQWTLQVLNDPQSTDLQRQFKGFLVGNPFTSFASGSIAFANILWGLQLVPAPAWEIIMQSSCELLSHDAYFFALYLPECLDYMDAINYFVQHLNPYALGFPVCPIGEGYMKKHKAGTRFAQSSADRESIEPTYVKGTHQSRLQFEKSTLRVSEKLRRRYGPKDKLKSNANFQKMLNLLGGEPVKQYHKIKPYVLNSAIDVESESSDLSSGIQDPRAPYYDPCTSVYTQEYLSDPDVQEALHVGASSLRGKLGLLGEWSQCSDEVNENWAFSDYLADTTYLYSRIYNHPNKPKDFKMLIFSGDNDGVCATVGTQNWVYDIQGSKIVSLYKPWSYFSSVYGTQHGGFITKFTNMLTFITIHFSGHEAPAYQPESTLHMFEGFLSGAIFSTETSSSTDSTSDSASNLSKKPPAAQQNLVIAVAFLILIFVGMSIWTLPRYIKPVP